jgi:hypothetical protein
MNLKNLTVLSIFIIQSVIGYSQNNPDHEILVYFADGITQATVTANGKSLTKLNISDKLKKSLNKIGIADSSITMALPGYKRADTLKAFNIKEVCTEPDMSKLYRIKVQKDKNRKVLIEELEKLPEILYAEVNGRTRPAGDPIDVDFPNQWALKNTTNPGNDIHAIGAWDIYKGNPNNIIAIIDGGIPSGIADLDPKISGGDTGYGWDGHGGHVAGIAAAVTNNGLKRASIAGVDWYAKIHPQRVDIGDLAANYQAIVDAVNYSPNVHVLNHSYSIYDSDGNPIYSITVRQAIAYAYKKNRTNVAASGNDQSTHPYVRWYPAGYDKVIAVGATTSSDRVWPSSSQGDYIDVAAPGNNIISFYYNNTFSFSGTSQASPHVAGIASLLKGFNPNLANDDIENIIELSADDIESAGFDYATGFGRVNAERALQFLGPPYTFTQLASSSGFIYSTSSKQSILFLGASGLASAYYFGKLIEVRKNVTFPKTYSRILGVWGRGNSTSGWSIANPNYGEGYCSIVPGTLTNSGATLRTYVYELWNTAGGYCGYFPTSPTSVNFAYTILAAPGISGPYVLCSSNVTYSILDVPAGQSVIWNYSSNLQQIATSSNSITLKPISGGSSWIRATIGSYTTENQLWSGIPFTPTSISNFCCNGMGFKTETAYVFSTSMPGATQYDWIVSGGVILYGQGTNSITVLTSQAPSGGISFDVSVRAGNTCGWSGYLQRGGFVAPFIGTALFSVYPNPTSSEVTISVSDLNSLSDAYSNYENISISNIVIIDPFGNMKKKIKTGSDQKAVTINISDLPKGIYMVKIGYGLKEESHKLLIE